MFNQQQQYSDPWSYFMRQYQQQQDQNDLLSRTRQYMKTPWQQGGRRSWQGVTKPIGTGNQNMSEGIGYGDMIRQYLHGGQEYRNPWGAQSQTAQARAPRDLSTRMADQGDFYRKAQRDTGVMDGLFSMDVAEETPRQQAQTGATGYAGGLPWDYAEAGKREHPGTGGGWTFDYSVPPGMEQETSRTGGRKLPTRYTPAVETSPWDVQPRFTPEMQALDYLINGGL